MRIVCVLRSGGVYGPDYVSRLARGIVRHARRAGGPLVCLTDAAGTLAEGIEAVPLRCTWPGWWAKMEMFRPDLFPAERILYVDLDTVVVGDLADVIATRATTLLEDFRRPRRLASGLMMLRPEARAKVWAHWSTGPESHMDRVGGAGDQRIVEEAIGPAATWQQALPGQVVSFKPRPKGPHLAEPPPDARVVCFHGHPKPHEVGGWIRRLWR